MKENEPPSASRFYQRAGKATDPPTRYLSDLKGLTEVVVTHQFYQQQRNPERGSAAHTHMEIHGRCLIHPNLSINPTSRHR